MYPHYHHFLHSTGPDSNSSFWGGFSGAFFAFVFGLITYIVTKRRERFIQHKNALVQMDRFLNRRLNDLANLEEVVQRMGDSLSKGKVTSNRLFTLQIPEGVVMELGSIDLANKLFSYQLIIDRFNFNVATANHALTRLEDLFIAGRSIATENFNFIRETLENTLKEIPQFTNATEELIVLERLHQKKLRNKSSFVCGVFNSNWDLPITGEEIAKEHAALISEIEQVQNSPTKDIL